MTGRRLIPYFLGLASLFGWVELVGPPVMALFKGTSAWVVFGDLLQIHSRYYSVPLGGYFFLLTTFGGLVFLVSLGRSVVIYWENATVPLSVLETKLTLEFSADLSHSTLTREQIYHANRAGQTAYHIKSSTDTGTISDNGIHIKSWINNRKITKKLVMTGNPKKSVQIMEVFDAPLPTNFLATLLPDMVVLLLFKHANVFRSTIARRNATTQNDNEYNGPQGVFSLESLLYPVSNVDVTIKFPVSRIPPEMDVYLIKQNAVEELNPERKDENGFVSFRIIQSPFAKATLRFLWRNAAAPG
ncbi:MAG: hypothetical protein WDM91_18250 [Rhizomicrobium sp.]